MKLVLLVYCREPCQNWMYTPPWLRFYNISYLIFPVCLAASINYTLMEVKKSDEDTAIVLTALLSNSRMYCLFCFAEARYYIVYITFTHTTPFWLTDRGPGGPICSLRHYWYYFLWDYLIILGCSQFKILFSYTKSLYLASWV